MFDDFKLPKIRNFEDITPYQIQSTGIYDKDKAKYTLSLDKTVNPNMICPYTLRSGTDYIEPGYYEVALSDDKRFLFLIQSRELKAIVPAIKVVIQKDTGEYQKQVNRIEEERKKLTKKHKKTDKLDSELKNMHELELQAKIYDSKEGYYIIEYRKFNVYAWGYVPI